MNLIQLGNLIIFLRRILIDGVIKFGTFLILKLCFTLGFNSNTRRPVEYVGHIGSIYSMTMILGDTKLITIRIVVSCCSHLGGKVEI